MRSQSVRYKALEELKALRAEFSVQARLNEQRRKALDRAAAIAAKQEMLFWVHNASKATAPRRNT